MERKQVLVYRALPPAQLARLQAVADVIQADPRDPAQLGAFHDALATADGLIGSSYRIDDILLDRAPKLKAISTISVGVDQFPLESLARRGITLCHTPGVLTETVADLLFAMILGTSRRIVELGRYVQQGRWKKNLGDDMFGWDVYGKTVGILGYGRIGQALARRAALGFDMPVLYHSRRLVDSGLPDGRARAAGFEEVLRESDFVVVLLPLTDQTRGLIGAKELALMKPEAILINGARGPIVDEDALLDALDRDRLRGAGLDVFNVEPLPLDSPLRDHPKVMALPHAGSATHETRAAMARMAVDNLLLALEGKPPLAAYPLA
ncbi:bifunctional glyoxylate/hydroxypyruvate reductase B [Pusillimonas sp. TS35]|jgi:gluconate 2-dehydrogenase|uniref:2-hydroxyacid dehydrogenase n=1 Tax=Paracandidimonas lactea TaxID=2895524 RepID=UPI00136B35FD|nr:D-glycerate dehydrogenase [Paracandidimonas lactea]MYN13427.1 bifunctional glyoxylate/hydroxypyruvate reductase B [Pusillimonas sp. TS35]